MNTKQSKFWQVEAIVLISLITLFAILLAGCGSASTATGPAGNSLSDANRMALGTLKLEGTSQAVTTDQAANLLTLWQGYGSLSSSDTASQVELEALVKQIQAAMTSGQIEAIDAMDLTDPSISETLSTLSGTESATSPASTPSSSALSQAGPEAGGPGGMQAVGGDSLMSVIGGGMSAQSMPAATIAATSADTTLVNPVLIHSLIQLLELRSQSAG